MEGGSSRARLVAFTRPFTTNFANASLRRAHLSFFAAWAAEWAFTVGLSVAAYEHGGAAEVGVVAAVRLLPAAVVATLLAPWGDRWHRTHVLLGISLVRAAATGAAALALVASGPGITVYVLATLSTMAATLYRPAHSALLPFLCSTPYELASANAVRGLLDSLAALVGPAGAALLLKASGVPSVFVAAAVLSLLAGVAILGVDLAASPSATTSRDRAPAWTRVGLREIFGNGDIRILLVLVGLQTLVRGAFTVFAVLVSVNVLHAGQPGVGTLTAALGAGAIAGSIGTSMLSNTGGLARWLGVGVLLWGLPFMLIATASSLGWTLAMLACVGVGNALVDVCVFTVLARVTDGGLARVFGILETVIALCVSTGALVTPLVVQLVGLRGALVAIGVLPVLVVAVTWARLRRLDRALNVRTEHIALLRGVAMLEPLALTSIELLARHLESLEVPAGQVVVAQGDPGDHFYVIEAGTAEVLGDGQRIRMLGPGESFGEIALLRDVPRTATVRATTTLTLKALPREWFLSIVAGYPGSVRQAEDHMQSMLDRFAPL